MISDIRTQVEKVKIVKNYRAENDVQTIVGGTGHEDHLNNRRKARSNDTR